MSAPRPGWYPDPSGRPDTFRWWDGVAWTRSLTHDYAAPAPAAAAVAADSVETPMLPVEQAPAPVDSQPEVRALAGPGPDVPPVGPPSAAQLPPGYVPGYPLPRPARHPDQSATARGHVLVGVAIGALVLVLAVVGGVVFFRSSAASAGPDLPPPPKPGPAKTTVDYDSTTRKAAIGDLQATLPTEPWTCSGEPIPLDPLLADAITCEAVVHKNYAGSKSWYASIGFGVINDSLIVKGDINQTAANLFAGMRTSFFADTTTTVKGKEVLPLDVFGSRAAVGVQGDVHYTIKGLPSSHDLATVVVIELDHGGYGAWIASRPNDTSDEGRKQLQTSLDSITVQ